MEGKKLLSSIRLQNLLSYGANAEEVVLEPLNVLIGPNASGKSNLIEAIGLLRAAPKDIEPPIREGGGITEWVWKGSVEPYPIALIEVIGSAPLFFMYDLVYRIRFAGLNQKVSVRDEVIAHAGNEKEFFYHSVRGQLTLVSAQSNDPNSRHKRTMHGLKDDELNLEQSILSQLKDPIRYPELTHTGRIFSAFKVYKEWNVGRRSAVRLPAQADLPDDFLLEDASNLALILNDLEHHRASHRLLIEKLNAFYHEAENVTTKVRGGTVQIFLHEKGLDNPIPATRLSDGTLRYLCLLAILCHPSPPPLICIEEPELGLHPDVMPVLAELLIEASKRTQLIVTTHSSALISALSHVPEAVLVCERDEEGTHLRRLEAEPLKEWLETYTLGELWRMGEIGGNP